MDIEKQIARLREIQGCLSRLKTTTARRRHQCYEDDLLSGIDPFVVDGDIKIANSKSYRRMLDKTQVVTYAHNAHIRKRITHTGEVTAAGVMIASILGLNVNLARAIGLGHDIGHTPFGHAGEEFIKKVTKKNFRHEIMSVVLAQHVERGGAGLNLTHEVLKSITQHSRGKGLFKVSDRMLPEASAVMFADKIAYLTGDYNDFRRFGVQIEKELVDLMDSLGDNQRRRVARIISDLCFESAEKGAVSFSECETAQKFARIRELMYAVYPRVNVEKPDDILGRVYEFISRVVTKDTDPALVLALMTDRDVLFLNEQRVLDFSCLAQTTVAELLPVIQGKEIHWWEPDLDW